jgi:hypothetical protein
MYSGIALPADSSDTVNGILTVRVMNELTSPLATADVTVLVFVRAADNIEFAAPKEISDKINYFTVQGDIQDEVTMGAPSNVDENVNLVYMGETIISLRELLQRSIIIYHGMMLYLLHNPSFITTICRGDLFIVDLILMVYIMLQVLFLLQRKVLIL